VRLQDGRQTHLGRLAVAQLQSDRLLQQQKITWKTMKMYLYFTAEHCDICHFGEEL
jgi:tRNA(Arg) A34 adenosine deaminase TadA